MEPIKPTAGIASLPANAQRCPLCGKSVSPEMWGLMECSCGWGGPDDPLETARGVAKLAVRIDRRLATRTAKRDLRRLASGQWKSGRLGFAYAAVLLVASTLIFGVIAALLAGSIALGIHYVVDRAWLGVGVCAIIAAVTVLSLFVDRPDLHGVQAPHERFPRLWTALDEVSGRIGAPRPHRVVLLPIANAFVFQHRPLRRLFRRELVLGLGVGTLPLLSEVDFKALLAHELAHYRHGHTALHRYIGRAETALRDFIDVLLEAVGVQHQRRGYSRAIRNVGSTAALLGAFVVWILTLPIRALWALFHLLRLAESRAAEFDADRTAIEAYGTQAFADMHTGIQVAANTLQGSAQSLRQAMRAHGSSNFYAEMRRHYAELPPQIIVKLRLDALKDFRSLEHSHPTDPDRLRAAIIAHIAPPPDASRAPAYALLTPAGAEDANAVETAVTALLFTPSKHQRRP